MSLFTEPGLKVNFVSGDGTAVLLEEIAYEVRAEGSGDWLVVPREFVTDGLSVPRPLWSFMPPWGSKSSKAAIIHDYLIHRLRASEPHPGLEDRRSVDREFATALLALGISAPRARLLYLAVRAWSVLSFASRRR